MANSLASSADAVLGASTLPQEPVYFAPIELSDGLYSGQQRMLLDKYEADELSMAKRDEALQQSITNSEELLQRHETLSIQSGTISKMSELLKPLSPTYSEDRLIFLDMAGRSPAVYRALQSFDQTHTKYNLVLDKLASSMASGMIGPYEGDRAGAPFLLDAVGQLLNTQGDGALPAARALIWKHRNQQAIVGNTLNESSRNASRLANNQKAIMSLDLNYNKTLTDPEGAWQRLQPYVGKSSVSEFMPGNPVVGATKSAIIEKFTPALTPAEGETNYLTEGWTPEGLIEDIGSMGKAELFTDKYLPVGEHEVKNKSYERAKVALTQLYEQINHVNKVIANNQNYERSKRSYQSSVVGGATAPPLGSPNAAIPLTEEQEARAAATLGRMGLGADLVRGK